MRQQPDHENAAYVRAVHDKGLSFDLGTMSRRRMLAAVGGAGALALTGGSLLGGADRAVAACAAEVESETAGPFPADGSNGPDVRTLSGIVRSDIRPSFGTSTTVAPGVPLKFSLVVQNLGEFRRSKHLPLRVRRISRRASSNYGSYGVGH